MNSKEVILFFTICIIALSFLIVQLLKVPNQHPSAFQAQQQKTEYMQLCAAEGISAFHCLNNWMGVNNHGD